LPFSSRFGDKQQAFLDFVLSQYVKVGVQELDKDKLSPLLKLKYSAIADAVAILGKPEDIAEVFSGFQKYLYEVAA
jgi:type I restriction enzyme R subunit